MGINNIVFLQLFWSYFGLHKKGILSFLKFQFKEVIYLKYQNRCSNLLLIKQIQVRIDHYDTMYSW